MALNINGTTGISGVDGSVSAPALTGTDSNTGITFPSADTIKFSTGGVERISITNSGISGTGISSGGLAMADQWRWTTEFTQTNTGNNLATTSDWERPDSNIGIGSNPLGTGMTQSSGVFSFPSTGYYWIFLHADAQVANDSCELFAFIKATENNSSYSNVSEALDTIQNQCTPNYITVTANYLARVTDTSNHKVHFRLQNSGVSVTWKGDSFINRISATFLKLGDT
tara:strand:+ start:573 stop:1253 length:681 start_codon:yes stop_codon:yes gene_type:complete